MLPPLLRLLFLSAAFIIPAAGQSVFVNELHYDNSGSDTVEGVEVAGPAGTDLSAYDLVFYNGSGGAVINTVALHGTLPDQSNGFGVKWFGVSGVQNDMDGLALVRRAGPEVVQRLAWEGSFFAAAGPAAGMTLPDIGVAETSSTPVGFSLQLTGAGQAAGDFTWSAPSAASPDAVNAGQTFAGSGNQRATLAFAPGLLTEGQSATGTLTLHPAPAAPVVYSLSVPPDSRVTLPAQLTVPVSGIATFSLTATADGVADGFQEIPVLATDPAGVWPTAGAGVQVIDADRPARSSPDALRLMSLNVKVGVGSPGGEEFAAQREIIERVSPDVLLLQEVDGAGDFADCRALLRQAGFPEGAAFFATGGDAFAGQPYHGGDFNESQNVVIASRYPITRKTQIGRGIAGRKEIARFPLFVVIDLPGVPPERDPAVVNVHLKALQGAVLGQANANGFRRAVEARRVREFLTAEGRTGPAANVFIGGDFNATDYFPQEVSYQTGINTSTFVFEDGSKLPVTYQLGADLAAGGGITLPYRSFPHSAFTAAGLNAPGLTHADGITENTFLGAGSRFDYWFAPAWLVNAGAVRGEVYNSAMEAVADGLPKRIAPPPDPALSRLASDHYATFLDVLPAAPPALRLTISPESVKEPLAGPAPVVTVSLSPPPAGPVEVGLDSWRGDRLEINGLRVVLTPSRPEIAFPLPVPASPLAEPDRAVSLRASAAGFAPAFAALRILSPEAAGMAVISQYSEPPTGSSPRGLEILNTSGRPIQFLDTPLEIRRYANGGVTPAVVAMVADGMLPAGAVLVIGDGPTGDSLVAQNLLPAPASPFAGADEGAVFSNAAGAAVFVKDTMDFNGNDALEVRMAGCRCDVFGTIGSDPGTAWTGGPGNPSTTGQNLALRPEIVTGSEGFTLPGTRFVRVTGPNTLNGFGISPAVTDSYFAWISATSALGLERAPNADPDRDGRLNLLEYALGTAATEPDSENMTPGSVLTRAPDAWLSFAWEHSPDLQTWAAAPEVVPSPSSPSGVLWQWSLSPGPARQWWRLRVNRP